MEYSDYKIVTWLTSSHTKYASLCAAGVGGRGTGVAGGALGRTIALKQ
jgi:hypothetical protein